MYIDSRRNECSENSIQAYHYRLKHWVRFCNAKGIENMNEVSGRTLQEYKTWRRNDGDLNTTTLKSQLDTLRVYIRFCESIDGVESDLSEKIISPTVGSDGRRDVKLESDKAEKILNQLSRYQYASVDHVLLSLMWSTGVRLGTLVSFDLGDYDRENQWLSAIHRPDEGTPLKNKKEGERFITLTPDFCQLLDDYIRDIRRDNTDDYDREPLITSSHGRISKNQVRKISYELTCPDFIGIPCDCNKNKPWECPDSVSPHAIRRGAITHMLSNDVPIEIVGDRVNASRDVLGKWYDRRTPEVKANQRRGYLSNI